MFKKFIAYVGLILALTTPAAFAESSPPGLFTFLDAKSAALTQTPGARYPITVSTAALLTGHDRIEIALPGQTPFIAVRQMHTKHNANSALWIGTDGYWEVVITVENGFVAGLIANPEQHFEIEPKADGNTLRFIDQSAVAREPDMPSSATPAPNDKRAYSQPARPADGGTVPQIDIMVVYTPQALAGLGGSEGAMRALIAESINLTNYVYEQSLVTAHMRLVHTELAPIDDSDIITAGSSLRSNAQIAALRDEYGADLVTMFIENGGTDSAGRTICGAAPTMRYVSTAFASQALNVVRRDCSVGDYTFPHETGHSLGLEHDPILSSAGSDPSRASYPWSFGIVIEGTVQGFRTLMGGDYFCAMHGTSCPQILRFSNPSLTTTIIDGTPPVVSTVAIGVEGHQDNARTLNLTAPVAEAFRSSIIVFQDRFE